MRKTSAGVLPYGRQGNQLEVLLVHPGGPFWTKKDLASWSIAKGEYEEGEEPLNAALKEFFEETGRHPGGPFLQFAQRKQPGGKLVIAWAVETNWNPSSLVSNMFSMEWPRGSGRSGFPRCGSRRVVRDIGSRPPHSPWAARFSQ
jgi:predicted NUDIX family NTP pyrophosphohydrolase